MFKILCVCKGNTCRSPMMAEILRSALAIHGLNAKTIVDSAGVLESASKGKPANEKSQEVIEKNSLLRSLTRHKSKYAGDLNLAEYDLFIVVGAEESELLQELGALKEKILVTEIPNPYGGTLEDYYRCYSNIGQHLRTMIATVKQRMSA